MKPTTETATVSATTRKIEPQPSIESCKIVTGDTSGGAHQYAVAKSQGLSIVSFDADFNRTDLRRQTPVAILAL